MESTFNHLAELAKAQRTEERVGSNEPFLENDSVAELGYCWENVVLGGRIQRANQVDHPLFFSGWPSLLTDADYPRRAMIPRHYISRKLSAFLSPTQTQRAMRQALPMVQVKAKDPAMGLTRSELLEIEVEILRLQGLMSHWPNGLKELLKIESPHV